MTDGFDSNDAAEAWNMLETPEDVVQYLLNGEIGITVPVAVEDLSDISIIAPINQPEDVEKSMSLLHLNLLIWGMSSLYLSFSWNQTLPIFKSCMISITMGPSGLISTSQMLG